MGCITSCPSGVHSLLHLPYRSLASLDSVVRKNAASQVELRLSRVRTVLHRSLLTNVGTDQKSCIEAFGVQGAHATI
jgi:hypothetical protein